MGFMEKVERFAAVSFNGVTLQRDVIRYKRERFPTAGVAASVETAGGIDRRLSGTRTVGGALVLGPLGAVLGGLAKKKVDSRQAFLLVEGPGFAWAVEVDQGDLVKAHKFAAKVTAAGRRRANDPD